MNKTIGRGPLAGKPQPRLKIVGFRMYGGAYKNGFFHPGWNIAVLEDETSALSERYFNDSYSMQTACKELKAEGVTGTDELQEDFIKGKNVGFSLV